MSVCTRALCTYYPDSSTMGVGSAGGTKQGIRHMSGVTCHMSGVRCQVSGVTCNFFFLFSESGGTSRWRVCYQWGLPRLVFYIFATNVWLGGQLAILAVGAVFVQYIHPINASSGIHPSHINIC